MESLLMEPALMTNRTELLLAGLLLLDRSSESPLVMATSTKRGRLPGISESMTGAALLIPNIRTGGFLVLTFVTGPIGQQNDSAAS